MDHPKDDTPSEPDSPPSSFEENHSLARDSPDLAEPSTLSEILKENHNNVPLATNLTDTASKTSATPYQPKFLSDILKENYNNAPGLTHPKDDTPVKPKSLSGILKENCNKTPKPNHPTKPSIKPNVKEVDMSSVNDLIGLDLSKPVIDGGPSYPSTRSAPDPRYNAHKPGLLNKMKIKQGKISSTPQLLAYNHATANPHSVYRTTMSGLPPLEPSLAQQAELIQHKRYLGDLNKDNQSTREEEARTAPLFTGGVMIRVPQLYNQYGLLGRYLPSSSNNTHQLHDAALGLDLDPRLLLNVSAPWSAFICGQQGSGKSHSLSCILENCLVSSPAGQLAKPLSGMIFHWDRYTGYSSQQICEAAYLATAGVSVRIFVSPSNLNRMRAAYENIPELKDSPNKPIVMPLLFRDSQLNVKRMMTMMGVHMDEGAHAPPLYVEVILRILREMAQENQERNRDGLNYEEFRAKLADEQFTGQQMGPMKLRLDLLESFLRTTSTSQALVPHRPQPPQGPQMSHGRRFYDRRAAIAAKPLKQLSHSESHQLQDAWRFDAGTLTIVDLSCPFVDENAACALFSICLELFLEDRSSSGRILALDEAHKFLNGSTGAVAFTEELLQVIRQQRHLGSRVVIATQEPTISPKLLELCNFTIVHRFQSPGWFKALQSHLAGASSIFEEENNELGIVSSGKRTSDLFEKIVSLQCGQALLFAPSAIIGFVLSSNGQQIVPVKLGPRTLRIGTRQRLTADGGRSIMAE